MLTTLPAFAEYIAQAQVRTRAAKAKARPVQGGARKQDVQTPPQVALETVQEEDDYVLL